MSKITALHTVEDLETLARGGLAPAEAEAMLTKRKAGLSPVQLAALMAAVNSGRLLELLDVERPTSEAPTQADRIERLLETMVSALEAQTARLSAIERALARLSR